VRGSGMVDDIVIEKLNRLKAYLALCRRYCERGIQHRGDSYSIRYVAIGIHRLLQELRSLGTVLRLGSTECEKALELLHNIGEAMMVAKYSEYTDEQIMYTLCTVCPCIELAIAEKLKQSH